MSVRQSTPEAYQCKVIQSTGMPTEMQLEFFFFWRGIAWPPSSCKAETIKQSIKTKGETDIVSLSVLSKVIILDYLSCPQI